MEDFNTRNREIGEAIKALRIQYPVPANIKGEEREDYLREHMTPADHESFVAMRAELIEHNRGFIYRQAHRLRSRYMDNVDVEDLSQGGILALMYRIWDWDPEISMFTTFAGAPVNKGMQDANDRSSSFEKKLNRENILEAGRLAKEFPNASFEERASLSRLSHFRDSPTAVEEWTAVALGWEGRVAMDAHSYDDGDEESGGMQFASAPLRGLDDDDAIVRALRALLPEDDVLIVLLSLGLDGEEPVPAAQVSKVARAMGLAEFPSLKSADVETRLAQSMAVLAENGDDIRELIIPSV